MKKSFTNTTQSTSAQDEAHIEIDSASVKLSSSTPKKINTSPERPSLKKTFKGSRYSNLVDKFREKIKDKNLEESRKMKRSIDPFVVQDPFDGSPTTNDFVVGQLTEVFGKLKPAMEQCGGEAVEQGLMDYIFSKGIDKTVGTQGLEDFKEALSNMAASTRSFDPEAVSSVFEKTGDAADTVNNLLGKLVQGAAVSRDLIFCIAVLVGIYSAYNAVMKRTVFHSSVTGICLMVAYATAPEQANGLIGPFFSQLSNFVKAVEDDLPAEQVSSDALSIFTSIGVNMLAIASGFTTKSKDMAKFVLSYLKDYGRMKESACDIITLILKGFEKAINFFSRKWFGKTVSLIMTGDKNLDALIKQVEQIEMDLDLKKMSMTMDHYHKILLVEESLNKALLGIKSDHSTTELRNLLRSKLKKIEKIRDKFRASSFTYDGFRQEPVSALFMGKPGQGKTQMMTFLSMAVCARTLPAEDLDAFRQDPDKFFYNRLFEQDFWDGYSSQWVVLFDDFCQIRDFAGREDSEIHNIIRAVNEHPYNLHMADISDKSNTTFRSPFVLATSNSTLENKEFESIKDPEAIRRRFDVMFDIRLKPQFVKEVEGGKYADPAKMPIGKHGVSSFSTEIVEFYDKKAKRVYTFDQIVDKLVELFFIKKKRYEQKRDEIDALVQESIAKREEDKSDSEDSDDDSVLWETISEVKPKKTRKEKLKGLFKRSKTPVEQGADDSDSEDDVFMESLEDEELCSRIADLGMFKRSNRIAGKCSKLRRTFASYQRELISRLEVTHPWVDVSHVGFVVSKEAREWMDFFRKRLAMGDFVSRHTRKFLDFYSEIINDLFDDETKPFMTLHAMSEFAARLWKKGPGDMDLKPREWLLRIKSVGASSIKSCWPSLELLTTSARSFREKLAAVIGRIDLLSGLYTAAKFVAGISGIAALAVGLLKLFQYMTGPKEPKQVTPYIKSGGTSYYMGHPEYERLKKCGIKDSSEVIQETGKPIVKKEILPYIKHDGFLYYKGHPEFDKLKEAGAKDSSEVNQETGLAVAPLCVPLSQSFGHSDKMRDRESLLKKFVNRPAVSQSFREFDPGTSSIMDLCVAHNSYEIHFLALDGSYKKAGYVVAVRGRLAIAPTHFLYMMVDKLATIKGYGDVNIRFVRRYPAKDKKVQVFEMALHEWFASVYHDKMSSGRDWIMFIMPREAPMGRDIVKKFILEKHVEESQGKPFSLAIPRQEERVVISGTLGPLVYNHDVKNGAGDKRQILRSIMYDSDTNEGDCGAMLFVLNKNPTKGSILGFHIMGHVDDRKGFSTIITREMLEEMIKKFPVEAAICEVPNTVHELMGLAEQQPAVEQMFNERAVSGVFSPMYVIDHKISHGGRSAIRKSLLYEQWGPAKTAPARLHKFTRDGIEVDPYEKALSKYIQPFVAIPTEHISIACTAYFQHLAHVSKKPRYRRVFTFSESVEGFEDPVWSSISRGTSAGFPYSDHPLFKGKGKARIWGTEGDYDLSTEQSKFIEDHCNKVISDAKRGIRHLHVFTDCLKDERRPLEKVENGTTRLFSACPLDLLIIGRMYFGAFSIWFTENNVENGSAIGLNPYGAGWDYLAKKLESMGKGKLNGAGDQHHYDGSCRGKINWGFLPFINSWYDDGPENARVREVLWYELINSRHVWGDLMLEWANGTPSGHFLTALINTMHNHVLFILCYMHIFGNTYLVAMTFYQMVYLIVLGDDNAFDVKETIKDEFDEAAVAKAMAQFGMVYTSELKGESQKGHRRITEIEFLKRSFRYEDSVGRYVAPLRLEVVLEIPYWTKKGPLNREIVLDNVQNTLDELSLHGEDVFNEWAPKIIKSTQDMYSYVPPRTVYQVCKAFVLQREQFY